VAGSGYNTVGDAAIAFLTKLADDGARARVPTTLNPIALDLSRWQNVMQMPADLHEKQVQLNRAFEKLGVLPIYSCAPYWTGCVPKIGSNVAWGEHNAVAFANSIIGARTNFESHMATIPAAISGRIPYYGMYVPENRKPRVSIEVTARLRSPVDWRCLGVAAAKKVGAMIPLFHGLCAVPTVNNLRDLCASFGPPWTSAPMLHIQGITPEACGNENAVDDVSRLDQFTISDADLDDVRRELSGNRNEPIDLVALGCPQYSLNEIKNVADRLRNKHVNDGVQLWVWTDASTRAVAERLGLVEVIVNAGGAVIADTCGCAACPVGRSGFGFRTVATDSTKSCGFLGRTGLRTYLGTVEECIDAAATGIWSRRGP